MSAVNGTLDAVRSAERRAGSEEADAIHRIAAERAEKIVAQAHAEAASAIARRCAAAERLAESEERERLAEAQSRARATVLRAQRSVLSEAHEAAHAAIRDLVGDPRLTRLLDRLVADARKRLTPAGPVQISAAPDGGFVARAGSREIDYSLAAQTNRVLEMMAGELEQLWR